MHCAICEASSDQQAEMGSTVRAVRFWDADSQKRTAAYDANDAKTFAQFA